MRTLPKLSSLARLLNPYVAMTVEESIRSRKADCRACELYLAIAFDDVQPVSGERGYYFLVSAVAGYSLPVLEPENSPFGTCCNRQPFLLPVPDWLMPDY